jgi:predicted flavoprotein YhiN
MVNLLKYFTVTVTGTRPIAEAIVTAGGISVKEVDPRTMESQRVKGLYFAGEVLDVDGYTGGYNLQQLFQPAMQRASTLRVDLPCFICYYVV